MRREILIVVMLAFCVTVHAQKKWDGEGGDGKWETAANWSDNTIPIPSDDVVLDNSIMPASFDVLIAGTAGTIICHALIISPAMNSSIRLIIPNSNTLSSAFGTTASGYSIQLKEGAMLINSSGATNGAVLSITDSMRIENNARYVHRTPRANAAIMNSISSSAGTEKGIVEFDVPVVSGSYIVALTNRTFGTLIFSATANNGPLTYTSNGSNRVLIRGDLQINPQVSLSVGFNDTIRVKGNFLHNGNLFNLSNNGNPTVLQLEGDIAVGGTITETNTAQPVILCSGAANQDCNIRGNLLNEIVFKLEKSSKLILSAPLLLPFNLEMKNGVVKSDAANLITLSAGSKLLVDSLMTDSTYIDGPLRKLGLFSTDHFLFPVGKPGKMRWLELKNATGDFTVEFLKSNPYLLAASMNGVDHISRIEYWSVESSSPMASTNVELSFDNVNSGGVTQLSSLRVAQLLNDWTDQGNAGTTGSAGAAGSVRSNNVSDFTGLHRFFTLASVDQHQNPLPLRDIQSNNIVHVSKSQLLELRCNGNISSNQLLISIQSRIHGRIFLKLFSASGQLLWLKQVRIRNGMEHFNFNLPMSLSNGLFYLAAFNEELRSNVIILTK